MGGLYTFAAAKSSQLFPYPLSLNRRHCRVKAHELTDFQDLSPPRSQVVRIDALAIEDALAVSASPGSLLLEITDPQTLELARSHPVHAQLKVLAAGPPSLVDRHAASKVATTLKRPNDVLIPGLVNAHSHLDLTHIGPLPPHGEGDDSGSSRFMRFVDIVRQRRFTDDQQIAASVRAGIESSLSSGVVAVGDISGAAGGWPRLAAHAELLRSPLWGTSFVEFFAIGTAEERGLERLEEALQEGVARVTRPHLRLGISPHAPYTVSRRAYMAAAAMGKRYNLPLMTHLSETAAEHAFVATASGPQRELLERLGIWSSDMLREIGHGATPVSHLQSVLSYSEMIAVHCNGLSGPDIARLLDAKTRVVFCPRASAYFKADEEFGPHRYPDLLFVGIKVALGTDSVINLYRSGDIASEEPFDPDVGVPAPATPLSILEEMRLLYRRDAIRAMTLLGMATMDGATVLGLDPLNFTFKRGAKIAGVVAVNAQRPGSVNLDLAIDRILLGNASPELLYIGK